MTDPTTALTIEAQALLIPLAEPGANGRLQNPRAAIGVTEYELITRTSADGYGLRRTAPARITEELLNAGCIATITDRFGFTYYVPTIAGAEARAAILY